MTTKANNPSPKPKPAAPQRPAAPGGAGRGGMRARAHALRQTIIPLLLTLAALLPSLGVWFYFLDEDSPFRSLPAWTPGALLAGGVVSGALAAINIAAARRRGGGR